MESPREREVHSALSQYVNQEYNRALTHDTRRNVAFALVILQRRLASSTYALLRSLEQRKCRLEELLKGAEECRLPHASLGWETAEEMSEEDRWKHRDLWKTLTFAETREELEHGRPLEARQHTDGHPPAP